MDPDTLVLSRIDEKECRKKKGLLLFALIGSLCSFGSVSEARRDLARDKQEDVHILCCFQDVND